MSKTSMDFSKPKGRYSNNVISSIRMNCVKNREMPALICEDRTVSWEQMWDRTARLANGLMDLGMAKGDRLAIFLKPTRYTWKRSWLCFMPCNFPGGINYRKSDAGNSPAQGGRPNAWPGATGKIPPSFFAQTPPGYSLFRGLPV